MKLKYIIILVLFSLMNNLYSLENSTGFSFIYSNTIFMKNHSSTIGMKWDWIINNKIILGGEYHSFISDDSQNFIDYLNNSKPFSKLNYGGLLLGYNLTIDSNSSVKLNCLLGSGGLHLWNKSINEYSLYNLILFEPSILFEEKLTNNISIGISNSYKYVLDWDNLNHYSFKLFFRLF